MRKPKIRTNIDRIKLCFTKPQWLWDELCLRDAYVTEDFTVQVTDRREAEGIVDRVQATLEIEGQELGYFSLTRVSDYIFFEAENAALYRVLGRTLNGEETSTLGVFLPIFHELGLTIHSVSSVEVCIDTSEPVRARVKKAIRNRTLDMFLLGRKVPDFKTRLTGVTQVNRYTRAGMLRDGTLYVNNSDKSLNLKIYDKLTEMQEATPHKQQRTEKWDGFLPKERVEVTIRKEYLSLYIEQSGLESFDELVHNISFEEDRLRLFLWACHRLIHFRAKTTNKDIEVAHFLLTKGGMRD